LPFDAQKVKHVGVVRIEGAVPIAHKQNDELTVDPELVEGFLTAVIIFAKTPVRTIRKASYDILIEVGDSCMVYAVLDPVPDETPYRNQMKQVLKFAEGFSFPPNTQPASIREIATLFQNEGHRWIHIHLLQSLLSSLGLSWMGFLDGSTKEHLEYILPRIEGPQGQGEIQEYVRKKICEQIDREGTTIGFDIERMMEHPEFVIRIDHVITLRRKEIEDAGVKVSEDSVNLKNLWLTAYGYNILQSGMNAGLTCDIETFSRIEEELEKIDISIRTNSDKPPTSSRVSRRLRDYIWEMARHNSDSISSVTSKLVECFLNLTMHKDTSS